MSQLCQMQALSASSRWMTVTIAWFSMLSLFLNGTRVPLETTDKIGDRTADR
jgi:hypothetical protein